MPFLIIIRNIKINIKQGYQQQKKKKKKKLKGYQNYQPLDLKIGMRERDRSVTLSYFLLKRIGSTFTGSVSSLVPLMFPVTRYRFGCKAGQRQA